MRLSPCLTIICHVIRWASLAWLGWSVARTAMLWSDPERVGQVYARIAGTTPVTPTALQLDISLAIVVALILMVAVVVVRVWQLFGHYLRGEIFTESAVSIMAHLGWAALAASIADLLARPLLLAVLTGAGNTKLWGDPHDLLHLMVSLLVIVMAQIYRAGVAMAEENRQIV